MQRMMSRRSWLWCVVLLLMTGKSYGQLFDESYPSLDDYRSVGLGASAQNFYAAGGNTLSDSARIRITNPLWSVEYRQMGLRVAFGYSPYKFNNENRSEISLAAESITDIGIASASDHANFFLPIVFSTNFVQASGATNSTRDFNIANVGIGTGLKFEQVSENFGFQITGVGVLYYSTAGFSVESGSSTSGLVELQFLFRGLIGEGMTAGYRFEAQSWSMSDKSQNYTRLIQGPFIGIFF